MFAVLFVLAGCSNTQESPLAGTWKVDATRSRLVSDRSFPGVEERVQKAVGAYGLELSKDTTFVLKQPEGLGPSTVSGNWTSDADKITLTVTNGPQIELKLDPKDNSCTYRQRLPFGELDVVLVKSPSK
jgi:hypothetical protein